MANVALGGLFYYKEHTNHPKLCNKFPTSYSEKEPDLGAASDSCKWVSLSELSHNVQI